MESYGTIDERSAATPKKLVGRRIIAAVAAVALVVGASAAVSVNRRPGDCIQTGIAADGSISCDGGGCPQTGSTAKGGITCPDDPCAKCGEGGMTGRPRAFYSPPGQPPIPVPAARCAKGINGLTDCTDLCQKFPNADHTTTCCKCYPAC